MLTSSKRICKGCICPASYQSCLSIKGRCGLVLGNLGEKSLLLEIMRYPNVLFCSSILLTLTGPMSCQAHKTMLLEQADSEAVKL